MILIYMNQYNLRIVNNRYLKKNLRIVHHYLFNIGTLFLNLLLQGILMFFSKKLSICRS